MKATSLRQLERRFDVFLTGKRARFAFLPGQKRRVHRRGIVARLACGMIVCRQTISILAATFFVLLAGSTASAQSTTGSAFFGPVEFLGNEASRLDFGAGAFNIQGHQADANPEGRVEFRYGGKLFYIGPAVGILADTKGAVFGYGGLYSDIALGRFVITPLRPSAVTIEAPARTSARPFNFASA